MKELVQENQDLRETNDQLTLENLQLPMLGQELNDQQKKFNIQNEKILTLEKEIEQHLKDKVELNEAHQEEIK